MRPDGTHLMLFSVSSYVCMPSLFRLVTLLFFLTIVTFLAFFGIQKGVWPYRHA